jgi:hypothetical protein
MIYIYCTRPSEGARELVREINAQGYWAKRTKTLAGVRFHHARGTLSLPGGTSVRGLSHGLPTLTTFNAPLSIQELQTLRTAGVCCPEVSLSPESNWLPRRNNHQGGSDLLRPPVNPDYYVKKYEITKEFRVHIFRSGEAYSSIRAGLKVPRDGVDSSARHPWIRSYDAGWRLDYGEACQLAIRQSVRDEAKKAIKVLGLDFGAVDVGVLPDGRPLVLEVNRAPGNEGNTTRTYATKFIERANQILNEGVD